VFCSSNYCDLEGMKGIEKAMFQNTVESQENYCKIIQKSTLKQLGGYGSKLHNFAGELHFLLHCK
jgi:hypothetical protein